MLGADSFGFGTAPMIVLGCKYLRICHLNNCATAWPPRTSACARTTSRAARARGELLPAAGRRSAWLAVLPGARSLEEIVGRTDLLRQIESAPRDGVRVDLSRLLADSRYEGSHCAAQRLYESPDSLATQMDGLLAPAIEHKRGGEHRFLIHNTDRSIGARLAGAVARAHGNQGMAEAPLELRFRGSAGQSFGAFNVGGLHLEVEGEANDYVGKGMVAAGWWCGRRVARASRHAAPPSSATPACTVPPAVSCSLPPAPASASRCAIPAHWPWSKVPVTTAAST